jgi:diguanylate cyclase (GGDEF)-like protein
MGSRISPDARVVGSWGSAAVGDGDGEGDGDEVQVIAADRAQAKREVLPLVALSSGASVVMVLTTATIAAGMLDAHVSGHGGLRADLLVGLVTAAVFGALLSVGLMPPIIVSSLRMSARQLARERVLRQQAHRREVWARLSRAFDMAQDETEALVVVERALAEVAAGGSSELLLADHSQAHLSQVAVAGGLRAVAPTAPAGTGGTDGLDGTDADVVAPSSGHCPVDSPHHCVAARRAQALVFPDGDALDACPKLRDRPGGPVAAVCVPVAITGRTAGVIHTVVPAGQVPSAEVVELLETLADQAGARLGMVRMMAETRLQASTDGLTGLLNRRSLENEIRTLRDRAVPFALVMADLDHFKQVNDTYGHEAGDRALRIFADVVRAAVRPTDLVCRYGGEEFVLVLPGLALDQGTEIAERIREHLVLANRQGDAPPLTCSFGVAHSDDATALDHLVGRADAALLAAKRLGRNRVVADPDVERLTRPEASATAIR